MPPKINGQDVSTIRSKSVVNKIDKKIGEQIMLFSQNKLSTSTQMESKLEDFSRKLESADQEIQKLKSENKQILKVSQELFVLVNGIVNVMSQSSSSDAYVCPSSTSLVTASSISTLSSVSSFSSAFNAIPGVPIKHMGRGKRVTSSTSSSHITVAESKI